MKTMDRTELLGPALNAALEKKGYDELTAVQAAVLEPALSGRDLRITSQTGSGKTVAIGFAVRELATAPCPAEKGVAAPRVLILAPTRELARQVEEELGWLFAKGARVVSVTGGASYREEHRALSSGPSVVVATPGRLLDHLNRGAINAGRVGAVVLDEADRMLDLGFRDDLLAIFALLPQERITHLVSATFPKEVRALADRVQKNAAFVEGTRLGEANVDIDHVVHVVEAAQKVDAIVNLLLQDCDAQTLVFARTRADVGDIAEELAKAGFRASSLSGDMDQNARHRALAAFKRRDLHVLVATDVAARGIDVQDISRVIHVDVPTQVDAYIHRSGRTGRAGRKGTSSLLVTPKALPVATRLLRSAGLSYRLEPIPTAEAIRAAADERLFDELTRNDAADVKASDSRIADLVRRIVESDHVERALSRLLVRARTAGTAEPREVRKVAPRDEPKAAGPGKRREPFSESRRKTEAGWVPFHVSWGQRNGADARRLLALVCRRGNIESKDVGAIQVEPGYSIVEVSPSVAERFGASARKPDSRDRRVIIRPYETRPPSRAAVPKKKNPKKRK